MTNVRRTGTRSRAMQPATQQAPATAAPPDATPRPRRNVRRIVAGSVITLFWVIMMLTLVRDHILPQRRAQELAAMSVSPATLVENWRDVEEFMIVRFNERPIGGGLTRITRDEKSGTGFVADIRIALNLDLLGTARRVHINGSAWLDADFSLSRFQIEANLAPLAMSVAGMEMNDELLVEARQGDAPPSRARYTLGRSISLLDAVRPLAMRSFRVEPGASISVPVVDPVWSMELGMVEISVLRRETIRMADGPREAFRVQTRLNDFASTSWVDADGATLRRQLAGGFVLDRADSATVERVIPGIDKPMSPAHVNPADFAGVRPQPIQRISDARSSPLSILGALAH